ATRAASSTVRWESRAAMAASCLRPSFCSWPTTQHLRLLENTSSPTFAIADFLHNPLACVRGQSDECCDRGHHRKRSMPIMTTFTIDSDNNITAHATAEEATAVSGAEQFTTTAELAGLAANWPANRLVDVWNSLPGV